MSMMPISLGRSRPIRNTDGTKEQLTEERYQVTQHSATGALSIMPVPLLKKEFIVDVTTGEPLCWNKFESGCGWPSFSRPIANVLKYYEDKSHGMGRIECAAVLVMPIWAMSSLTVPEAATCATVSTQQLRFIQRENGSEGYGYLLAFMPVKGYKINSNASNSHIIFITAINC